MSAGQKVKAYSAMEVFNTLRIEGEIDLVALAARDLEAYYCKEAAALFLANVDINTVKPLNPLSQRVIINRWLNNCLLSYRSRVENPTVNEILLYVINDGTHDNWLELLQLVVFPFFKLNNVLNLKIGA